MPKYYCDYCDTCIPKYSRRVRKTHCSGRSHKENVKFYYQKWMKDQLAQSLIDAKTAAFKARKKQTMRLQKPPVGAMIPPPTMFGSFPTLPQGLMWASRNTFQPATYLAPNYLKIRNQQPIMFMQQSPTQTMFLPVAAGAASAPVCTVLPQRQTHAMHQMAPKTDIIEKVMPKIESDAPHEKQQQKTIARPHNLTHVTDGIVIYESSDPFPVRKSVLMSPEKSVKSKENDLQIDDLKISELKWTEEPKSVDESKNNESRNAELSNINEPKISELEPKNADLKKDSEPKDPQLETADTQNRNEPKIAEFKTPDNAAENNSPRRSIIKVERDPATPPVVETPGKRGRKRKLPDGSSLGKQTVNPSVVLRSNQIEIINLDEELPSGDATEKVTNVAIPEMPPSVEALVVEQPKVVENPLANFARISPSLWSVQDVYEFVQDIIGFGNYAEQFRCHEIDGKALLLLQDNHVMTITNNILGPAVKLISCINNLKKQHLGHSM